MRRLRAGESELPGVPREMEPGALQARIDRLLAADGCGRARLSLQQGDAESEALRLLLPELPDAELAKALSGYLAQAEALAAQLDAEATRLTQYKRGVEMTALALLSERAESRACSLQELGDAPPSRREAGPAVPGSTELFSLQGVCGLDQQVWALLSTNAVFARYPLGREGLRALDNARAPFTSWQALRMAARGDTRLPLQCFDATPALHALTQWTGQIELLRRAARTDSSCQRLAWTLAALLRPLLAGEGAALLPLPPLRGETFAWAEGGGRLLAECFGAASTTTLYRFEGEDCTVQGRATRAEAWGWRGLRLGLSHRCSIAFKRSGEVVAAQLPDQLWRGWLGGFRAEGAGCLLAAGGGGCWAEVTLSREGEAPPRVEGCVRDADGQVQLEISLQKGDLIATESGRRLLLCADVLAPLPRLPSLSLHQLQQFPCTDSRFRPDRRALECCDFALATAENERLQASQPDEALPRWFAPAADEALGFAPAGDYWARSAEGRWPADPSAPFAARP